jgi:nitrogen PTS system EIIA component
MEIFMKVQDFLVPENIVVGVSAGSKEQLLRQLSELVGKRVSAPAAALTKALLDREGLGSTGIGQGVAMPHAAVREIETATCIVARLAKPIDFEAVDDVPVDLVILLLTPTTTRNDALNILSCMARRFRDEECLRRIRSAHTAEEIYTVLIGDAAA